MAKKARPMYKPEEKPTLKEQFFAFRNIPRLLGMIWGTNPWLAIGSALLRLVQGALPLASLYVGKLIVDEIVHLTAQPNGDLSHLWTLIALEFALAILGDLFQRVITLLDAILGDLLNIEISLRLMRHANRLDLDQFEDADYYDKLERARRETYGQVFLMTELFQQVQDLITIIFLSGGLIAFQPWLILVLALSLIPSLLGESHFARRNWSLMFSWTPERRELDYLRHISTSDYSAKEIKVFDLGTFFVERFEGLSRQYYRATRGLANRRALWSMFFATLSTAGYYAAYVLIAYRTATGVLTLGDLTFLVSAFQRVRGNLSRTLMRFTRMAERALNLKFLFDFFDIEPRIIATDNGIPVPNPIRTGFVFENVGFRYRNSERWALRNLSFTLSAGETLALVGENGAGKTTLVKLLSRLYDPSEGRILLDGVDLREYDLTSLRRSVGVIFQDFIRYDMTVAENIGVGEMTAENLTARIEDAARKSLASDVIDKLPRGYEQMLGKRFDDGVNLSGGEWQKVALARAYMREAQLIILDEPTAALDARAEHEVFKRFADLAGRRTSVIISHRFSTVRMADRILFLENGGLLEMGTHQSLLAKQGRYAELFNLQAAGYR